MYKKHDKVNILIVEDEAPQRKLLKDFFTYQGYNCYEAERIGKAKRLLEDIRIDIALLDIRLPDGNGIELLKFIKKNYPHIFVIMLTAMNEVKLAVESIKAGAYDYLVKPIQLKELLEKIKEIEKEIKFEKLLKSFAPGKKEVILPSEIEFVFASEKMKKCLKEALSLAPSEMPILIIGESGTGKTLLAKLIHLYSRRKNGPFIELNLAAIPESLMEAELFGYVKGAFTGAEREKKGLMELAKNGTLFLDEIGELSPSLQVKLLKALEEGRFYKLGDTRPSTVDFRLISATNRDVETMIEAGEFRQDLFYRISGAIIHIPALRERKEDIKPLAEYFIKKFNRLEQKSIKGLSQEALNTLMRYPFPGNVRELENIIHRAVVLAEDRWILKEHLPPYVITTVEKRNETKSELEILNLKKAVEDLERELIRRALELENGVKLRAAKRLGISEKALRYKMQKLGLE